MERSLLNHCPTTQLGHVHTAARLLSIVRGTRLPNGNRLPCREVFVYDKFGKHKHVFNRQRGHPFNNRIIRLLSIALVNERIRVRSMLAFIHVMYARLKALRGHCSKHKNRILSKHV